LGNRNRLQTVVGRELRAFRLERALNSTLSSAREYKKQLQHIVEGSTDAIETSRMKIAGLSAQTMRPVVPMRQKVKAMRSHFSWGVTGGRST